MVHFYQLWLWHVFANKINQEYMALTKIDTSSKNKLVTVDHYFVFFQYCNWREMEIKECYCSFTINFFFFFFFRYLFFSFFWLGFTSCKAEQTLRGMELQEKKHNKDYRIQDTGFMGMFKKTGYNLICKLLT